MEGFDLMLVKQGVFLYKIRNPSEKAKEGSLRDAKVADWNFSTPERRCKVVIASTKINVVRTNQSKLQLQIQLQDEKSGDLICKSIGDIDSIPGGRESCSNLWPVADSQRFYILKVKTKNPLDIYEFYGLGFSNRVDSLDLKDALNDYIYNVKMEKQNQKLTTTVHDEKSIKFASEFSEQIKCDDMLIFYYCDISNCGKKFDSETALENHKSEHEDNSNWSNDDQMETPVSMSTKTVPCSKSGGHGREKPQSKRNSSKQFIVPRRKGKTVRNRCQDGISYRHPNRNLFRCHLCKDDVYFTIVSEKLLIKHWHQEHGIVKPNICKYCSVIFTEKSQLDQHRNQVHQCYCNICSIAFQTKNSLRRHLNKVHFQALKIR